jgi:hypothetical protein
MKLFTSLLLAAAAALLSSCGSTKTTSSGKFSPSFDPPAKQPSNRSAVKVKISTGAQRIYVMEGDKVLLASPCSTGTASDPTPLGTHRISEKNATRRRASSPGAGYPMSFWMSFYSPAYGMHWGWVKPYPCTHGCVRLPIKTAQKVFNMVSVGTPISIARSHPEDATAGAGLPVLDDSALSDPPMSYMLSSKVFSDAQAGKIYNY